MIQQFHFLVYIPGTESKVQKKYFYTHAHSSIIHESQEVEATYSPLKTEWINKIWYTYIMEYYSDSKGRKFWCHDTLNTCLIPSLSPNSPGTLLYGQGLISSFPSSVISHLHVLRVCLMCCFFLCQFHCPFSLCKMCYLKFSSVLTSVWMGIFVINVKNTLHFCLNWVW
jgi:hypothetical protein